MSPKNNDDDCDCGINRRSEKSSSSTHSSSASFSPKLGGSSSKLKHDINGNYSFDNNNKRLLPISAPTLAISTMIAILLISFGSLQYYLPKAASSCLCPSGYGQLEEGISRSYNDSTIGESKTLPDGRVQYEIAVVTDLDQDSIVMDKKNTWRSIIHRGRFLYHPDLQTIQVEWNDENADIKNSLYSQISAGGRAMELSDLTVFDGHLLTVDDRTGLIYRIENFKDMVPWVMLNDGPGNTTKGFKAEWMTVKDQHLHVGGLGKEWTTTDGKFVNYNPMWIKVISPSGAVNHVDWTERYKRLRRTVGIEFPGYMIHETGQWSKIHQKWFFLPRRASNLTYTEEEDEHRGTNLMLVANEDFSNVEVRHVGSVGDGSRGFSAFQFLPGTNDQIAVALKSEERGGRAIASYLCVFRVADGQMLLDEQKFDGPYKFEGIIVY